MYKSLVKATLILSTVGLFTLQSATYAASNYNYTQTPSAPQQGYYNNPLQGAVVYTPAGITTTIITSMPISSETLYQGAIVNATLPSALAYNGQTIAPAGSMVSGSAIMIKKAGKANKNGQVYVRFNSITTPQGFRIPISAIVRTDDNTGILKGGTKMDGAKDFAKNTAVGAAGGAVLGTALGAMSGGSVGKGAIYGTAVGGGLGLAKAAVMDKGDPVEIPANSAIEIYFDQPITVGAPSGYNYY